jgi:U4/U6 small nuclear ribonucleoprotein SNU13
LKKGANEATKSLNRGTSELIVLARDASPLEIILHLPLLCEDKNVAYIFVNSKAELGQACGTSRPVVAASILKDKNSSLNKDINALLVQVDKCFYQN